MRVSQLTDSSEVYDLEKRLQDTADKLAEMVQDYGNAKQVREFATDMRKRALAKQMAGYLEAGETVASAEAKARASFAYSEEMAGNGRTLREAEAVLAEWEALKCQWESCRSLLSMQRELGKLS